MEILALHWDSYLEKHSQLFLLSEDAEIRLIEINSRTVTTVLTDKMTAHDNPEVVKKLLENLQSDLKNISLETKKKYPGVKESAEEAIVKIRNASGSNTPLVYLSNQILYPLVQVNINYF